MQSTVNTPSGSTMEFCPNCDYMLYIESKKLDEDEKKKEFVTTNICKNCGYTREIGNKTMIISDTNTKYDTNIKLAPYLQDNTLYDPTIPHVNDIVCPYSNCSKPSGRDNDVMYMKYDHTNMKYVYKCTYCKQSWK